MSFDGMMTYAVAHELKDLLHGGKITKIYQPYPRDLVFQIRAQRQNQKLFISANPSFPRLHLTEKSYDNPAEAPMFCMLLRKHLEGGFIEGIEQIELERMIAIHVRSKNELGDQVRRTLMVEIMGKHSNIILLDPDRNLILDSIHHVSHAISQYRVVLPGREYVRPPEQHKLHPFEIDQDVIIRKLQFNQGKIDQQIVQGFQGISPLLAREIVHRAGLPTREKVSESFLQIISSIKENNITPSIIESKGKESFYLLPLEHITAQDKEARLTAYDSVSQMLEAFFHGKAERDRVKQRAHDFIRFLSNEKAKNEKKLIKLQKTMQDGQKADKYRLYGELITAYMHQIDRGQKSVEVVNYYDQDGATIEISLDPQKSVNDNAQAYYKKYTKAKNSLIAVEQQIKLTENEIIYFESLLQQIEQASPKDVEEMREELIEEGYIRDRSKDKQKKKKKNKEHKPQLEEYTSSDGATILLGKNNKQNDYLTMRHARASDIWLHTKDIPGSHVVIRSDNPSEQTILEAAQLAAYYSKAGDSSQVPVDYTQIRHVRKPNGAKPGYVIYEQQKTVYVTPSKEDIEKMRAT